MSNCKICVPEFGSRCILGCVLAVCRDDDFDLVLQAECGVAVLLCYTCKKSSMNAKHG